MSKFDAFIAALPAVLFVALKVAVVIGAAGTAIKSIGARFSKPKLVSLGEYLEHLGTNIPEIVNKLKGFFPKLFPAALVLMLACGSAVSLNSCANFKPAQAATVGANDMAIAYRAAGAALAVADVANAAYMDSLEHPTQADVDRETAITNALVAVQKKLDEVKVDVSKGREKLREAAAQLKDASALLGLAGVKIPAVISDALSEADRVLK